MVKKGINLQVFTIVLKNDGNLKKQNDFLTLKTVHRIVWGGVISQCNLHKAKGGGPLVPS